MSNGYLIAAEADRAAAYDLADGFGLEPLTSSVASAHDAAAIASAANVGIVLSLGAAQDAAFTTLVRALASQLRAAQLILIEPEARAAFAFLPEAWPSMSFALAHERATELSRRRQASAGATEPPHAAPLPPTPPVEDATPPEVETPATVEAQPIEQPATPDASESDGTPSSQWSRAPTDIFISYSRSADRAQAEQLVAQLREQGLTVWFDVDSMPGGGDFQGAQREAMGNANKVVVLWSKDSVANEFIIHEAREAASRDALISVSIGGVTPPEEFAARQAIEISDDTASAVAANIAKRDHTPQTETRSAPSEEADAQAPDNAFGGDAPEERGADAPLAAEAPSQAIEEPTPAPAPPRYSAPPAPAIEPPPPQDLRASEDVAPPLTKSASPPRGGVPEQATAPADATAFAPKKVRRGTPELVRVAIHQPKDLKAVIKAARQIDPRTEPAPQGMTIGNVALGASVGVSLEVRGAACDGTVQRRTWRGDPIDFNFSIEAEADVKQIVVLARVFIDDAQIGVLAFTRPVIGADKRQQGIGDKVRLKRHKHVFLSYSSKDRETVSAIATAYASAGVAHFWDRTSLQSGEEWSPRLRKEIERADLFHLCWSKSAAASEWVEKEASYALTRRRRAKKPDITVQMLDGPPWAKHPDSLDSINFDDFVRAAIVGYARGDGET